MESELIEKAVMLARDGRYEEAVKLFDMDLGFVQNPLAMSYYAISIAHAEGNIEKAVSLCLLAAEKEFYNPEIFLNLGKIFLLNGQKSVAVRAFRKGLKFDEANALIMDEFKKLGLRRKPAISFLPRRNMVNRLLGKLGSRGSA